MNFSRRVEYQWAPNRPIDHSGEVQLMLMSTASVRMPPMLISGLAMPEIAPEAVREMVAQERASLVLAHLCSTVAALSALIASSSLMLL